MKHLRGALLSAVLVMGIGLGGAPVQAIAPKQALGGASGPQPSLRLSAGPNLGVTPSLQANAESDVKVAARVTAFERSAGGTWEVRWDRRGDRPNLMQGSGVPLVPGSGNSLTPSAFGLNATSQVDLAIVQREAKRFLEGQSALLKLDGIELQPDAKRSTGYGKDKAFWSIEFGQHKNGIRVDGAFVYARVSHGNVVQFGADRIGEVQVDTTPSSTREDAFKAAWQQLGFPQGTQVSTMAEPGELRLYPAAPDGEAPATAFAGAAGQGYRHVLAWRYLFGVVGSSSSWEVLVDAHANRVIQLRDLTLNVDATVSGGVYPTTNLEPEVVMPFPFASVTVDAASTITDTLGIYDYSGGTATTSLDGKYFKMVDSCGAISLSSSTDGNLAFGTGPGTDCATPDGNTAGPGNTHASRTGFYHLTRINEKARGILPDNTWLQGKVTAKMNVDQTCNAAYNPSDGTVNFYKSGPASGNPAIQCGNTGEIAAVFLHEWGHGLDDNAGGTADENGSGEAVGDTFSFLETKESCIGPGFYASGQTCSGCTTCTGVRDVNDFSQAGTRTIASPPNVEASDGINCLGGGLTCPYLIFGIAPYQGPMGYEGHCESYIASSANWDLKNALVERFGDEEGYARMDGIWYGSLMPSKSAYQVQDGGQCNPKAAVNGCAATNWYTVYLAADDDDGDLSNGTPNACRIWDAMNAHGIACGERPVCSLDIPDFTLTRPLPAQAACAPGVAEYAIEVGSQEGFTHPVTLGVTGLPAGATASFSQNPATPGSTVTLTISGTDAVAPGRYTFSVSGSAEGSTGHRVDTELTINDGQPVVSTLTGPPDGAGGVDTVGPTLSWRGAAGGPTTYTVEVATDSGFQTIVASQSGLTSTTWQPTAMLVPGTRYYWRVRGQSACGLGADSPVFSFTTSAMICSRPALAIPAGASGASDSLVVSDAAALTGLRLRVKSNYSQMGPLKLSLSNGSTEVLVKDTGTIFSCLASGIDALFDDSGMPLSCAASPVSGVIRPTQALDAAFAGQSFAATWTLKAVGGTAAGTLDEWCLESKSGPAFSVGGTVGGLDPSEALTVVLNGSTPLRIGVNRAFTFPSLLNQGTPYAVSVAAQPAGKTCDVDRGSGVIAANVTNVAVSCQEESDRIFADGFDGGAP